MRNRKDSLMRFSADLLRVSLVSLVMLIAGTGVATAAESGTAQTEPETMSFGLLGPVGLAAVALGVVGMALGVLRQRRKAAAAEPAKQPPAPDEPTLTPYRRSA